MTALIIGSAGQDGTLLRELLARDQPVVGVDRDDIVLDDARAVADLVARVQPGELYYLAAAHHSSEERPDFTSELRRGFDVHVVGLVHVLEAVARHVPACRVFYAGSSQMFGEPAAPRQDETTPFAPRTPYAITKVAGAHVCARFRDAGVHVSVGILYNHESVIRGPRFVSQRIARGAVAARRDPSSRLRLGSLSAVVDWSWAPDVVDAMARIVRHPTPGDYVIASGEPHTVRDFARIAFDSVGLDYNSYVEEDPTIVRVSTAVLVGDPTKLRSQTGWQPTVTFEQMVRLLVAAAEQS